MATSSRRNFHQRPSLALVLLFAFTAVLVLSGGASRADVLGQSVVRLSAAAVLVAIAMFGRQPFFDDVRPLAYLLGGATLLAMLQLIPLPPALWQALPGRAPFSQAALLSGSSQPWRPLAIVPGGAANALLSLIVPAAMLFLVASLHEGEQAWLPGLLLATVSSAMLLGLLQLTGGGYGDPLINGVSGQASGPFANRNHFALLLALGCPLAAVWAFPDGRRPGWRGPVALGLVVLFVLTILASGSRSGIVLAFVGCSAALILARRGLGVAVSRYPRWVLSLVIGLLLATVGGFVALSMAADRAASISRVFTDDPGQDLRSRALPTVLSMIAAYFPAGAGLGGFDPLFRMREPFDLLQLTYFNRAHNDWLEVILDTGLAGVILLGAALTWWVSASLRAWRGPAGEQRLPRLGSVVLLMVMIASGSDYPARTPLIMAVVIVAAAWLSRGGQRSSSALPR